MQLDIQSKHLIDQLTQQLLHQFYVLASMKTLERPFVETESLIAIFHHVAYLGQKIALNERYDVRRVYHDNFPYCGS